ncbi:sensor histidine kinase [Phaeacidiphilus oryzae]|uniref:sensor histidine kinase n=1 Tax=Phaeacidiphilus oryzae TaxID=348818 RepID=UPI00068BBA36|nr:nitrate- and nitrite sensing domain-containing protein [Phaeacidiphilus oryzae]
MPLLSLAGLWIYTTAVNAHSVYGLIQVGDLYKWIGTPSDALSRDLQSERLAAVRFAAAPPSAAAGPLAAYKKAQSATDGALATVRAHAADGSELSGINGSARADLRQVTALGGALDGLRYDVVQHNAGWASAGDQYSALQDPFFQLRLDLTSDQAGELSREAGNLIELSRAREYISREQALVDGARESGRLALGQYQSLLTSISAQHLLFSVHIPELPSYEQKLYADYTASEGYAQLSDLEGAVSDAGQDGVGRAVPAARWDAAADSVLASLADIDGKATAKATARGRDTAVAVFERDALVGVLGLAALIISLMLSIRAGRRLVRELISLRNAAFDLANVRLPEVMRRLRDGERVNVAVEAPPIGINSGEHGDHDEIAQVGRAFNAVHRAAVSAAVDQAELRRGVSSVFVNLARRSQALLNRQLTLLDEMERRVADPEDLEDLFKLDHLTTRMRRHADGLLILSGSAPGRGSRRPVPVTDVVRAAVGEVEDYTRVAVPRLPNTAVLGSAVSDIVHLLAELVENATSYSPPHTRVRLRGERVANGFVLEIDDRGLGVGEEALLEANDRLTAGGDFDLADSDRLGLFVVSRLAQRHGVRVSLSGNAYGGTTAVVLLPLTVLADPETGAPLEASPLEAGPEPEADAAAAAARSRLSRERAAELLQEPRPSTASAAIAGRRAADPGPAATPAAPAPASAPASAQSSAPAQAPAQAQAPTRTQTPTRTQAPPPGGAPGQTPAAATPAAGSGEHRPAADYGLIEEAPSGPVAAAPPTRSELSDLPRRRPRTRPAAVPPTAPTPADIDARTADSLDRYPPSPLAPQAPPATSAPLAPEGAPTPGQPPAPAPGPAAGFGTTGAGTGAQTAAGTGAQTGSAPAADPGPALLDATPPSWRAGRPGADGAPPAAEPPTALPDKLLDGPSAPPATAAEPPVPAQPPVPAADPADAGPADADAADMDPAADAGTLPRRRSRRGVEPTRPESPNRASAAGRHRVGEDAPALPRRVRQASLAPQLRDRSAAPSADQGAALPAAADVSANGGTAAEDAERVRTADETSPAARERSPEEVRATFGSFQRGLARGRRASDDQQPGRDEE